MIKRIFLILFVLFFCVSCTEQSTLTGDSTIDKLPPFSDSEDRLGLVVNGICRYKVIYSEYASEEIDSAAKSIDTYLFHYTDVHIDIKNQLDEESPLEILVGITDRPESQTVLKQLGPGRYAAARVNDKIVLCGGSDEDTLNAVDWFVNTFIKSYTEPEEENAPIELLVNIPDDGYFFGNSKPCPPAPLEAELVFSKTTGSIESRVYSADEDAFKSYLTLLESSGFTKLYDNKSSNNRFCRFSGDELSLEAAYFASSGSFTVSFIKGNDFTPMHFKNEGIKNAKLFSSSQAPCLVLTLSSGGFLVAGGDESNIAAVTQYIESAADSEPVIDYWLCMGQSSADIANKLFENARIKAVGLTEEVYPGKSLMLSRGAQSAFILRSGDRFDFLNTSFEIIMCADIFSRTPLYANTKTDSSGFYVFSLNDELICSNVNTAASSLVFSCLKTNYVKAYISSDNSACGIFKMLMPDVELCDILLQESFDII